MKSTLARCALGAFVLLLFAVSAGMMAVLYTSPVLLIPMAAGVLLACAMLFTIALLARGAAALWRRAPELAEIEARIERVGPRAGRRRVVRLLKYLGRWPHRLDQLSPEMKARVAEQVRRTGCDPVLRAWVREATPDRQIGAIHLSSWLALPHIGPLLGEIVRKGDPEVAYAAAESLCRLDAVPAWNLLVGLLGEEVLPPSRVAALLVASPSLVLEEVLARRSEDDNARRRFWIAYLLGQRGEGRHLAVLLELSRDADDNVRASAAEALGGIEEEAARQRLHEMLADSVWFVQIHAVQALARLGDGASAEPIAALLESPVWWVRDNAARALEKLGPPAVPVLHRLLRSSGESRRWAASILVRLGLVDRCERALEAGGEERARALAYLVALREAGAESAIPAHLREEIPASTGAVLLLEQSSRTLPLPEARA